MTFDDRLSRIEARIAGLFWWVSVLIVLEIALSVANLWATVDLIAKLPK